jgi:beta-galactosidase
LLRDRPWLFGTWLWNAFDFGSTVRREGDSVDVNTKGLVTYDGTIRKDAFYYYRANWSAAPTVHITGRRYTQRAYPVTDVRVYSNAPRTELALNGRSLGARPIARTGSVSGQACARRGHQCSDGDRAIRDGRDGGSDRMATGQRPGRRIRIDAGALVAAHAPDAVFGSDAFFSGGTARSVDALARGRAPVRPEIAGTRNRDLAATFRAGAFSYRIPTGPGAFTVSLTFVEPAEQPGSRIFDVATNGQTLLKGFDIAGAAGGPLTEVTRSFPVTATDGVVTIDFVPVKGEAVVSAITVLPRR